MFRNPATERFFGWMARVRHYAPLGLLDLPPLVFYKPFVPTGLTPAYRLKIEDSAFENGATPVALFLLALEPVLDGFSFGRLHFGRGFFEHRHEPVHFFGRERMADVSAFDIASGSSFGVDDQIAIGIGEGEEREARIVAAESGENLVAAGVLKVFLRLALLHDQGDEHEMFFQHRLDFWGLDKLIESFAPASPRGAEDDEKIFLFGGGLGFRFGQKLISGGWRLGGGGQCRESHRQDDRRNSLAHGPTLKQAGVAIKENSSETRGGRTVWVPSSECLIF